MEYLVDRGATLALIPARGGSKGVPKKNIKNLIGYPLIAYTIVVCGMSKEIDRTIVTTDSEEIASIAKKYRAEVPFLRPVEIAGDMSGDYGFVKHALDWLQQNEGKVPEYIIHMRPTTPIREPEIVDKAINIMKKNPEFSSLRSAHPASESPFKWFVKKEDGCFGSIKEGISNEQANNGRQAFPEVFVPDGYVDVIRTEYVINEGILHGERMYGFVSPVCNEVDTASDFQLLEYEISTQKPMLFEYMMENYKNE